MKQFIFLKAALLTSLLGLATSCSRDKPGNAGPIPARQAVQQTANTPVGPFFKVDPDTAGSISGTIRYKGRRPVRTPIDMSEDPACVAAHQGKAFDESLVIGPANGLGNVFIYVEKGLEGKAFAPPAQTVTIDQRGCWFRPRVMGIQTGQVLQVINSDPVTHNIHPMAHINREWNHSQGSGDQPLSRRFLKTEVMMPVKCNIHRWMHAYIGVVDHPYFAVSSDDGTYKIENLPPGSYTIGLWQEKLGTQEQQVTVSAKKQTLVHSTFEVK